MKLQPKHLKSFWNKKNILFVSLCLIFVIGIGVTTAWLTGYDGDVHYAFQGAFVDCEVVEEFTQGSTVKSNVRVKNTGNVNAYFRAAYTVNWVKNGTENSDSPVVYGTAPQENINYTIVHGSDYNAGGWFGQYDGYHYYIGQPVKPDDESSVLIQTLTYLGGAPAGYHLQVTVLAEALQETPDSEDAYYETWYKTQTSSQSRPTKAN